MAGMPLTDPNAPPLPPPAPVPPPAVTPGQQLVAAKQASQQSVADTLTNALGATAAQHAMQAHMAAGRYAAALGDEANITGRAIAGAVAAPFVGAAKVGAYTYDNIATPIGHGLVDFARGAAGLDPVNWSAPPEQVAAPRAPVGATAAPPGAPAGAQTAPVVGTLQDPVVQRGLAIEAARGTAPAQPTIPVPAGYVLTNTGYAPGPQPSRQQVADYAAGNTARVPDLPGVNYNVPAQVASPRSAPPVSPAVSRVPTIDDAIRGAMPRDLPKLLAQKQAMAAQQAENTVKQTQLDAFGADYARNAAATAARFKPGTPEFEAETVKNKLRTAQQLGLITNGTLGTLAPGLFQPQ